MIYIKPNFIIALTAAIFNLFMILFPAEVTAAAKDGLLLWFNYALPSLLPFIIASKILTSSGFAQIVRKPLNPFAKLLFGMDGSSIFPIVSGFVSGCPVGAKTTCDLYKKGFLSKSDAQRLLCFTNNSGPLFILGTVAAGMMGDVKTGIKIMAVHYFCAVFTGMLLKHFGKEGTQKSCAYAVQNTENILGDAVYDGMQTILTIGGYIILFSVIISLCTLLPISSDIFEAAAAAAFEVTNGCRRLCGLKNSAVLCAAALSWGGISIHCQTYGFVKSAGLKMYPYIISRLFQAALSAAIMYIITLHAR